MIESAHLRRGAPPPVTVIRAHAPNRDPSGFRSAMDKS